MLLLRFGPLYHAHLFAAQENSGKLVTLVRRQARTVADNITFEGGIGTQVTLPRGTPDEVRDEVKRRILIGTFALSAGYADAAADFGEVVLLAVPPIWNVLIVN